MVETSVRGAGLDPQIREFIARMGAGFARFPPFDTLSFPEARAAAEIVRAPWAAGGPAMPHTFERRIPTPAGALRVRGYDPDPATLKPALIYLHGGGWTLFSLDTHDRVMREYAARAGITVIGFDYPLSPEVRFPVALEQIAAGVLWLAERGGDWGIDPRRIAIGGDSAGGNLAIATALVLRDRAHGATLKGMVLNYGVFSRSSSVEAQCRYGGDGYMLASDEMEGFWRNYLADDAQAADSPLACPIRARLEGLPPALLVIPECDLLTEQSMAMAARLDAAAVPVEAHLYRGASHSFLEAVSIAEVSRRAFDDSAAWLRDLFADT